MEWKFRRAIPEDKADIEKLFLQMLRNIYHTDDVTGYEEGNLDKFFGGRGDWICVAEVDGAVVGYLSIELHKEETEYIYLDDLSVLDGYQNLGIGTRLLEIAQQYGKDSGVLRIYLHVEKENEGALRLYRRLGYETVSEEGSRYRMKKEIGNL